MVSIIQFLLLLLASSYFLFLLKNLLPDRLHVILTSDPVGFAPCLGVLHSW